MADAIGKVHVSNVGTYHPDPKADVAWTKNDTRGYIDGGPSCDECGACECEDPDAHEEQDCIGLSEVFVCLDGGEALCEDCAEGVVEEVACDCE